MHYGQIFNCDVANGPGFRVSLFVSGCRNHCPGCFQPETWDFNYGKEWDLTVLQRVLELMEPDHIRGISILGGDPFEVENMFRVLQLLACVRGEFKDKKDVWVYTGYTYEYLRGQDQFHMLIDPLLSCTDVLVDGPFIQSQKDITLTFRGSRNQRLIDLNAMRRAGDLNSIILWEGN